MGVDPIITQYIQHFLLNHSHDHLTILIHILHKNHFSPNTPLNLNRTPTSYNLKKSLTKSYTYLSHTVLFTSINNFIANPKPINIIQESLYTRATIIYSYSTIRLIHKHIPSICD